MSPIRIALLSVFSLVIAIFFFLGGSDFLTFATLKSQQANLWAFRDANPGTSIILFASLYIFITGLSLPGAAVLTLAGGALFGMWWGTLIVSFASSIGATLAFLAARFLFREQIQTRFGSRLRVINEGIAEHGAMYLLTLRLVPLMPFFMINVLMGLTTMKTRTFYMVSQIGMLAGTFVYINAGTQLAQLKSIADVLSPLLIGAFVLLGLFPAFTRFILNAIKSRQQLRKWPKPRTFDNNVVVIGAGAGGLVTAYIAAAVKAKVTLIEKHQMGGDCLYTGCVPSKTLIRSAKAVAQMRRSSEFGIETTSPKVDFAAVMARVQSVITTIEPHDSAERYRNLGVDVINGTAKILSPWSVQIHTEKESRIITTRAIVIATGAKPFVPDIPGLAAMDYLTSDTLWQLREQPQRLLILGGGPIGCELAQALARLGSRVTLVDIAPRLLSREDKEVSELILKNFNMEGITVWLETTAKEFMFVRGEKSLIAEQGENQISIEFDAVLVALGRRAHVEGFGAEELGITLSDQHRIAIDDFQTTNFPNIFACGDVASPYQFTHAAAHQAWSSAVNALFGNIKKFRTDYSTLPCATFTDPEIARVGLNEQAAKIQGIAYQTHIYALADLDRAIIDSATQGFIKVLTPPKSDKILGVTIIGEQAGELLAEFVLAMRHNLGLNKVLATVHSYPTFAEANKYAAGVWKKSQVSPTLLKWLAIYHQWRRG